MNPLTESIASCSLDGCTHSLRDDPPYVLITERRLKQLLDEIEALEAYKTAYREWQSKTEWVQDREWDFSVLGKHRADVMSEYIERLEAKIEQIASPKRE